MLWINGQISAWPTMRDIFLPSLVSLLLPLALLSSNTAMMDEPQPVQSPGTQLVSGQEEVEAMAPRATLVLAAGVAALVFVPVFKSLTGLPPYLGMLFGLGALWLLTDAIHYGEPDRERLKVPDALSRIDVQARAGRASVFYAARRYGRPVFHSQIQNQKKNVSNFYLSTQGVLFFLGILLSISSLDSAGVLKQLATQLDRLGGVEATAVAIGLVSAVIDNVPLVAATMGMYDLSAYPADDRLWQLIAFCAGTGGSILVIGSASGVAFMGLEAVSFGWWLSNATGPVLAGYAGGVGAYLALHHAT